MHTNWLVTRVSLESDGFLEMDIQTHNYTPYDVNSILDIVASLGKILSDSLVLIGYKLSNRNEEAQTHKKLKNYKAVHPN